MNDRNWGTHEFSVCPGTNDMTVTINTVTLAPFNGASCGLAGQDLLLALFIGPDGFNPNAECENFIENNKPDFQGLGAGSSYTFQIPNAPGAYTLMMQNNCDTTPPQSIGSVDFEIN